MQSKKVQKIFTAACIFPALTGCNMPGVDLFGEEGFFRDRQGDYLDAESIPRIVVPDDKDSYIIDDLLVIPDLDRVAGDAFLQVPRPRPLQGNPDQTVVIQSMNESSWAVIDAGVNQTWPRVRQFWLNNDIELAVENPVDGVLETNWFIQDGNESTQEKFRVMVQPGFQDDSSEISLVHISVPQNQEVGEQVAWPEESMDIVYATEILGEISVFMANELRNYQASTVSFLAGNIATEGRASILNEDGINMLHLDASYERSWAAVGRALERAEIEILTEDIDNGTFSVRYGENDEEQEVGLLGRLIPGSRQNETIPFGIFLDQTETGVDVLALRFVDAFTNVSEEEAELQEQRDIQLINELIQTIRDFI